METILIRREALHKEFCSMFLNIFVTQYIALHRQVQNLPNSNIDRLTKPTVSINYW